MRKSLIGVGVLAVLVAVGFSPARERWRDHVMLRQGYRYKAITHRMDWDAASASFHTSSFATYVKAWTKDRVDDYREGRFASQPEIGPYQSWEAHDILSYEEGASFEKDGIHRFSGDFFLANPCETRPMMVEIIDLETSKRWL